MATSKNILILAASIGSGHMKAAEAIAEIWKKQAPADDVHIIDFSLVKISWATYFMKACYLFMLKFIPNLYEILFRMTAGETNGSFSQHLIGFFTARDIGKLEEKFHPSLIICTHPFPAAACHWRKKNNDDSFALATVITDYSIHKMWMYENVDYYFVAIDAMKQDLISLGWDAKKIFVTGIPIRQCFANAIEKKFSEKISDEKNVFEKNFSAKKTLLLMGGGLGLGGIEFALKELLKINFVQLKILVVVGKNNALKQTLEKFLAQNKTHHEIILLDYVENIFELMSESNLLISKPGALTISEAFACELPLLLHEPIPGPETTNAQFAMQNQAALFIQNEKNFGSAVEKILHDETYLERMKQAEKKLKRPSAANDIFQILHREIFS